MAAKTVTEWGVRQHITRVVIAQADKLDAENSVRLNNSLAVVCRTVTPWDSPGSSSKTKPGKPPAGPSGVSRAATTDADPTSSAAAEHAADDAPTKQHDALVAANTLELVAASTNFPLPVQVQSFLRLLATEYRALAGEGDQS